MNKSRASRLNRPMLSLIQNSGFMLLILTWVGFSSMALPKGRDGGRVVCLQEG